MSAATLKQLVNSRPEEMWKRFLTWSPASQRGYLAYRGISAVNIRSARSALLAELEVSEASA